MIRFLLFSLFTIRKIFRWIFVLLCSFSLLTINISSTTPYSHFVHDDPCEESICALYHSLDTQSLSELLAFYHLYQKTKPGQEAYQQIWELINRHRSHPIKSKYIQQIILDIRPIISLITKQTEEKLPSLSKEDLQSIENITDHLPLRKKKGRFISKKEEIFSLPNEEIDISRAIFIYQFGETQPHLIEVYEAYLDVMALQILARLPKNYTDIEAVEAINHFIFHEMQFRFPPHSLWANNVDVYTFLPSVIDSRHGVCLGVSILYLSLAQRLNLPLHIITPPGHIYLSYQQEEAQCINIETTARGVHIPTEKYLSIHTKTLKQRTIKEVIGLHFINSAAHAWQKKNYEEALKLYQESALFLHEDPLLYTLMGYTLLFLGHVSEGKVLLQKSLDLPLTESTYINTTIEDYLSGKIDQEGIQTIFQEVDETRDSILQKQALLHKTLIQYPQFREGILHLAITCMQLNRPKESLAYLKQYDSLDPNNPTVVYYLTILSLQRWNFHEAYMYLERCKNLLKKIHYFPKVLVTLEKTLRQSFPESLLSKKTQKKS